jgi:rubrerythrin
MAEVINDLVTNSADAALAPAETLSQFQCAGCGYGASCRTAPQRCPMCSSTAWEPQTRGWSSDMDQPLRRDRLL